MRRFPFRWRLPRRRSQWFFVLAGLVVAGRLWNRIQTPSRDFDFESPGPYHVAHVDSGDTLRLDGNIALRLIGVDMDAGKYPSAAQAAELAVRQVEGRDVTVALDRECRDRNGRILAYVYSDGSLLNEELIRAGFARTDTSVNIDRSMATRFRRAEDEARDAGRGIWQSPAVSTR